MAVPVYISFPDGGRIEVTDRTEFPATGRAYRDAWRSAGPHRIVVDMPAARDIHRDGLREARAPLLAALDIEWMRAQEMAGTPGADIRLTRIAARKQALRDAPADPRIQVADDDEALAALTLEVLVP